MILDLVLVSSIIAIPILAGALKDKSSSGTIRALTKIISPVVGIFPLCYLFYTLLQAAGVQVSFDFEQSANYGTILLILFAGCSYMISLRLVKFGERIGKEERSGIRDDMRNVIKQVEQILTPKLQDHASQVEASTATALDKKLGGYVSHFDSIMVQVVTELKELKDADDNHTDSIKEGNLINTKLQQTLDGINTWMNVTHAFLDKIVQVSSELEETYEILQAKIEAQEKEKKRLEQGNAQTGDNNVLHDTKLTPDDGMANRTIGIEAQHEMAEYLKSIGFDIKESRGSGEADFIIRKDDDIVAIGSNKAYMLHDEPKRMQRRISSDDVEPELILAKRLFLPLVIFVTNRKNGRRWAKLVSEEDMEQWSGVSTPVILAKDDEPSGKYLQEEFSSVLASIGAMI